MQVDDVDCYGPSDIIVTAGKEKNLLKMYDTATQLFFIKKKIVKKVKFDKINTLSYAYIWLSLMYTSIYTTELGFVYLKDINTFI